MSSPSSAPRPAVDDGRRVRRAATATLGGVLAGHVLLETGRDALFLAHVPAERLPFVYIAVAVLALVLARLVSRSAPGRSLRLRLGLLQALAAISVLGFASALAWPGPWLYYALYVWSGVVSSAIVVTFWLLLGDLFTITEGKRAFAGIAIGGSAGALAGSLLATFLAPRFGAEALLIASAGAFGLSALGPLVMDGRSAAEEEDRLAPVTADLPEIPGLWRGVRRVATSPYARRVALLVALSAAALTFGDYLFKSVLADEVASEDLSTWLARIYLGLNVASIGMLALGVTPLVRRLGVDRSLALLPMLLAAGALGVLAGGALLPIIFLKTSDGTLRYSLHRTASELLYLPMDPGLRSAVKSVIDLVGESTAKAVASIGILALVLLPEPRLAIAGALGLLALGWAATALRLRGTYLDVFRRTLQEGSIETRLEFPELDVASLESLIRTLGHPDERAVLAAMDLLVARGRPTSIPTLILHHPSPRVVERAIDVFASARHSPLLDFADRLVDHEYAEVRSAIVRAKSILAPDREDLESLARTDCPCVRVSAVAGLIAHGWIEPEEARKEIEAALEDDEPHTRIAIANAAKLRFAPVYREPLLRLASDPEPDVAREAVRAMRSSEDAWFTEPLVGLLADRRVREVVREALIDRGEAALAILADALRDDGTPSAVRRHVPRTISRFATPAALEILLDALGRVDSGMVRYKVLRGLQPMVTSPGGRRTARRRVVAELETTVERVLHLLHHEACLLQGREERPGRQTSGGRLLVDLLADKRKLATRRVFLLLSLLHPAEDFRRIRRALDSPRPVDRASGFELIESLLPHDLARAILGVSDTGSAIERLEAADPERAGDSMSYDTVVRELQEDASEIVRVFALYHASELPLLPEDDTDRTSSREGREAPTTLRARALRTLERLPEALARRMVASERATEA